MRTNILSKFEGPETPSIAKLSRIFSTKGPGVLDFCPQDHLLVRTNISIKFESLKFAAGKHCRIISRFGIKGHGDLDL